MARLWIVVLILVPVGRSAGIGLKARAALSAPDGARDPMPLRGAALGSNTGLRLLVPDWVQSVVSRSRCTLRGWA